MMNFTERAVPGVSANFLMKEAESRYHFAKRHINSSVETNILDVACGTGYGAALMATKRTRVFGIDISDEALSFAKQHYKSNSLSFLKMDAMHTLFRDEGFDYITAFEMIEHLKNPKTFLKEMNRILKKKGLFIVSTPNKLVQSSNGTPMSPYHEKEYTPTEFEKLLSSQFDHIELFGQSKKEKAQAATNDFMKSQGVRQMLVNIDVLHIRRFISKDRKEKMWKIIGSLFGRAAQEKITENDFIFSKKNIEKSEYLLALCQKK